MTTTRTGVPLGAPCPSPAVSPPPPPFHLPEGDSGPTGALLRLIHPRRLETFMTVYERQLRALVARPSIGYAYTLDDVPRVVARMREAFRTGTYNRKGHALNGTCRSLGISTSRRSIDAYLSGGRGHGP